MNERSYLQMMVGNANGGQLITGTDAVTGKWDILVINEDAVIESIKTTTNAIETDVTTARGFATKTITAGMIIGAGLHEGVPGDKVKITSVKLTSGSVMAY